jgi:CheY-like chemotaxis protein
MATVLVVDNEPEILNVMTAMFARSSYDVLTADSAVSALKTLQTQPRIDLVLSEASLPGMSGSELIATVEQSFPSTAVMFMTADTDEPLDPAIPRLQKPFTFDTLIKQVQEVLARSRQITDDFIRTDLELCLTFAALVETECKMGNRERAQRTLAQAEEGYSDMLRFFSRPKGLTAEVEKELQAKFKQVRERLDRLP